MPKKYSRKLTAWQRSFWLRQSKSGQLIVHTIVDILILIIQKRPGVRLRLDLWKDRDGLAMDRDLES